jgi:putative membrane-bound dehydrogenase-like protein
MNIRWVFALPVALALTPCYGEQFRVNGRTFTVPDGFTVELAAEPSLLKYPIFADFDEQGRLYVSEASGILDWRKTQPAESSENWHRMLRLEDTDGDGRFDRSSIFATFKRPPQGSQWLDGSLYVASPPFIWKLTDTDGDGIADVREKWVEQDDIQGCLNDLHGPYLGPDGWLYWTKGAGATQTYTYQGKLWSSDARHIYRRQPGHADVEQVMVGGMDNPVEVAFSQGGDRFLTNTNIQHVGEPRKDGILHAVYGGVYPKDISPVYQFPWTGPDMLTELAGWTALAPAGLMCYQSSQFGTEYRGNLFSALFNGHSVRRHILTQKGATFENQEADFLVCEDVQFHPTDVLEDADGSLLVVETGGWYRHCCPSATFYRPDVQGAMYRIRRKESGAIDDPRGLQLAWGRLTPDQLAGLLDDPRHAVQQRAMRQLGKIGVRAIPALQQVLTQSKSAIARCHACWSATRIEHTSARSLVRLGLADPDETVRQAALSSVSLWRDRRATGQLLEILRQGPAHHRRTAAEALGRIGEGSAVADILDALAQPTDRFLEHSLIFALIEIGNLQATRTGLASENGSQRRAAMIALDQIPGGELEPQQVIAELDSPDARTRETAWWIVSRHSQLWGRMLANWLGQRVNDPRLNAEQRQSFVTRLTQVAKSSELADWMSTELTREGSQPTTQILLLQVMRDTGGQRANANWVAAVLKLLDGQHDFPALTTEAIATLVSFPPLATRDSAGQELQANVHSRLHEFAARQDLSDITRLKALTALEDSLGGLEDDLFQFLLDKISPGEPLRVRVAAADAISHSKLTEQQLVHLAEKAKHLTVSQLSQILGNFVDMKNDVVGQPLVASLLGSPATTGLSAFRLRHVLAGFGSEVRQMADPLFVRLEGAQAEQLAKAERVAGLVTAGDPHHGLQVFHSKQVACASCHKTANVGGIAGPYLGTIGRRRSERDLIESLLFPSATLVQGYETWTVVTVEGRVINGVIQKDAPDELVLTEGPEKIHRIPRESIEEMIQNEVSIMPKGLDKNITDQDLADLVAYLKSI